MSTVTSNTLDIREIAPRDRHAVIFARFDELPAGESLELINDHVFRCPTGYSTNHRSSERYELVPFTFSSIKKWV